MPRPDYFTMAQEDPDQLVQELMGDGYTCEEAYDMIDYMLADPEDVEFDDDGEDECDHD